MGRCRIDFVDGFVWVGLLGCVWVGLDLVGWVGGCCIIRFCRFVVLSLGFGFSLVGVFCLGFGLLLFLVVEFVVWC